MKGKRLQVQGKKSKDVKPKSSGERKRASKKSADFLPKILAMAHYNGTVQEQWVRCGKTNCKCSRGRLHGPYFYFFVSMSSGLAKSYVRRADVPALRTIIAERKRRQALFQAQMRQAHDFLRLMMRTATEVRR